MDTCPQCGGEIPDSADTCPTCDSDRATESTNSAADDSDRATDAQNVSVSRRGLLKYSGATMALTWAGIGVGWYTFIYEPLSPEEKVVREYVDALDRSKFHTAEQLFHEDAPGEAWGPSELPEITRLSLSVEDTDVVDRETDVPRENVSALALVSATITIATTERSNTIDIGIIVAQNDAGEWKLWKDR